MPEGEKIKGKTNFQRYRAISRFSALPLPLECLDAAQGGPGAVNKDLKFYYLPLLPEAEPVCRFTARVNRKFVFTSFLEKKASIPVLCHSPVGMLPRGACSDGYGRQE